MAQRAIPLDILDDLSCRFIINIPAEDRRDLVRICFQVELAHWFYLDFYCEEKKRKLKRCNMNEFSKHLFAHIPFLRAHLSQLDMILEQWREYKHNVPTFGAIILNEDMSKVLLVQNYWSKHKWGFPKGKINEDEDPSHCAAREVLEETGLDISNLMEKDDYMESIIKNQLVRLYVISGVREDTKFQPLTRKEIKYIEWFALSDLPSSTKDMTPKIKMGVGANSFYLVAPFISRIRSWVAEEQRRGKQLSQRNWTKSLRNVKNVKHERRRSLQKNSMELETQRQPTTCPVRNRQHGNARSVTGNSPGDYGGFGSCSKKTSTKKSFKRNLFGDSSKSIEKSPTTAAEELRNILREFNFYDEEINTKEQDDVNVESFFKNFKKNDEHVFENVDEAWAVIINYFNGINRIK